MKIPPASAFFQWTKRIRARGKEFASFRVHAFLTILALGYFGYVPQAAAQPVIFHYSISALPGDAVSLQGAFSDAATVWLKLGAMGDPISLPVETQQKGHAIVQIPSSLAYGFYQVWVEDNGVDSPAVNINQAWGQFFVTPEVAPNSTFRLFGRNLKVDGATPQVRFVNHKTGVSISNATVDAGSSDPYVLSLIAPGDVEPDTTYDIYVSNGLAGPYDSKPVDKQLRGISGGVDYFGLGVAWAQKYNFYANTYNVKTDLRLKQKAIGDGVENDYVAIQNAITQAYKDGGGRVYLPPGTYRIDATSDYAPQINMRRRVVLQGAGPAKTTLTYGYSVSKWDLPQS